MDIQKLTYYDQRVVLFLDILGFKKHVTDTVDKDDNDVPDQITYLNRALERMGEIAFEYGEHTKDRMVTQFSDSIVISFDAANSEMMFDTLNVVLRIWVTLLMDKIICRGALSVGKLVHTPKIVFGPAMVDAYETESKAAMYPRIIMNRTIYNLGRAYSNEEGGRVIIPKNFSDYVAMDFDGKYYLDYFNGARHVLTNSDDLKLYFSVLREIIVKGSQLQQPDLKVKYGYMKHKYNDFLNKFKDPSPLLISDYGFSIINELKKLKGLKYY